MSDPVKRVSRRLPPLPGHHQRARPTATTTSTMPQIRTQKNALSPEIVKAFLAAQPQLLEDAVLELADETQIETWLARKRGQTHARLAEHRPLHRVPSIQDKYMADDLAHVQQDIMAETSERVDQLPIWYEMMNVLALATRADACNFYALTRDRDLQLYSAKADGEYSLMPGVRAELNTTAVGYVAVSGRALMTKDASCDDRCPNGAGLPGSLCQSVICLPVTLPSEDMLGVIELTRGLRDPPFSEADLHTSMAMLAWMGAFMYESSVCKSAVKQSELNDYLLSVSTDMFADIVQIDLLIEKIMGYAKDLVQAERCTLFLTDREKHELYSNLFDEGELKDGKPVFTKKKEIRFHESKGIAGHVARTKEVINIVDAYSDPRFNREIDKQTGYTTHNLLCMPVIADSGVVGVVQMVNKRKGDRFTKADESAFKMFAVYCAIALYYSKMLETIGKEKARYKVAIEQMTYHLKAPEVQIDKPNAVLPLPEEIDSYQFYGPLKHESQLPELFVSMMTQLFGESSFDLKRLLRFTLTVRKNYRPVSYHNWQHGWNVAHCIFVLLRRLADRSGGSPIPALRQKALMIAALSHDVDHRGYNNAFYSKFMEPLATLYPTSVLERHHYSHLVTILQQEGHDVFSDLAPNEYKQVLEYMHHAIIATDLALHFPRLKRLQTLIDDGKKDIITVENLDDVIAMMMTGSDLCAVSKPWNVQRVAVDYLYQEFYSQGDIERSNGFEPIPMMDRSQSASVPKDQVGFIQFVCQPLYQMLATVLPEATGLEEFTARNLGNWRKIAEGKEVNGDESETKDS